ncbi:TniQ family protein [Kitasatospora sp. NPDC092286]|uniref:TniQ family protein n=1 Tax=Kitasatospora sp. NPDC092286 TaxID=3364087 RepID=UPI0037FC26AE
MKGLRTLAIRVAPLPGESLDSWLEALARRNWVSTRALLRALELPHSQSATGRSLVTGMPAEALRRLEWQASLPAGSLESAVIAETFPAGSRPPRCRFCPQCLAGNGGRWPLRWWLPWTFACRLHQAVLHDICPDCGAVPRQRIPSQTHRHPPARCTSGACQTDLSAVPPLRLSADHPLLNTQHWIDDLLDRDDPTAATVLADLDACTTWLARAVAPGDQARRGPLVERLWREAPALTHRARHAVQHGMIAHLAQSVFQDSEVRAVIAIQDLIAQRATLGITTSGLHPAKPVRLSPPLQRRFLRALDSRLPASERLRFRSCTATARYPQPDSRHAHARARHLPQVLWPGWSVRLLPTEGASDDHYRATVAACLHLPGATERGLQGLVDRLNLHRRNISDVLRPLAANHPDVLVAICDLADYLDQHGSPVDYEDRLAAIPTTPISYEDWRELCFRSGAEPGGSLRYKAPRLVHAQRYLHQMLTGSDLTDPTNPLALRTPHDRSGYSAFLGWLNPAQRRALHEHAAAVLRDLGLSGPPTWEPPKECARGLALPGRDPDDIDLAALHRLVTLEKRPLGEAAQKLGTSLAHVRLALEHLPHEPRPFGRVSQLSSWHLGERTRQIITREFLQREYVDAEKSFVDIAREQGLPKKHVIRRAKDLGVVIYRGTRPIEVDEAWLREQYLTQTRSIEDIGQELGVSGEPLRRRLEHLQIPRRPGGTISHPDRLVKLDDSVPPNVRACAEGTLHGWLRLRRFQIAMAFPTLNATSQYLEDLKISALTSQFNQLELAIGDRLYHRSVRHAPQRPTERGQMLLRDLAMPHIQDLMATSLGSRMEPLPSAAEVATATAAADGERAALTKITPSTHSEEVHLPPPLLPLLGYLLTHPEDESNAALIHTRTGISLMTINKQLRRLHAAGWLTSCPEDRQSWLSRGRAHGRRRTYYALTTPARRIASDTLRNDGRSRKTTRQRDNSLDTSTGQDHETQGHGAAACQS